jgi:hypothetical protein
VLQKFVDTKYPPQNRRQTSIRLFKENWAEKALSLGLAIVLWTVFLAGTKISKSTYRVPVTVENLPSGMILDEVQPPEVKATLAGSVRALYLFDRKNLGVTIDASLAALGRRTFRISGEDVRLPKGLTLQGLSLRW